MQRFINNWTATLTAPALSGDLALSIDPAKAALLTGLGSGDYYLLTLAEIVDDAETNWEIVKVTAVISGVLTVERGQEGTSAAAWSLDAYISARLTAAPLQATTAASATAVQPGDLATVASSGDYADLTGLPTIPTTAAEVGAIASSEKGAASGVATLDAASKIPLAQLPATAITDTSVVASEAAMLALTAQTGDVAIRTDISKSFILRAEPATTLGNWEELLSPASGGGAPVGTDTPQNLGSASPGVSTSASRQDHVHALPTAADVGADAAGAAAAAQAAAVQRTNHTGSQAISTVTGLQAALDAKQAELVSATNIKTINGVSILGSGDLPVSGTALPAVRAITANETLGLSNINTFGVNATASNYTSTIPPQATVAWTAAAELHFLPTGTGNIVIQAGAGVSLNGVSAGSITLRTAYGAASIKRIASDSWWVGGVTGTQAEQRDAIGLGAGSSPTFTALTLSNGQIVFPATQVPSANANTMDDYEEGTWTPVLTFATPGDLSVAYSTRTASYTKIGRLIHISMQIVTSVFTHTTAAGTVLITGLPFTSNSLSRGSAGMQWSGITKAGYTDVAAALGGSSNQIQFTAASSGSAFASVVATDMPSGGSINWSLSYTYFE